MYNTFMFNLKIEILSLDFIELKIKINVFILKIDIFI
jgi:hypothetical protein